MKQILHYALAILIVLGIVACGSSNSPEKVVESFHHNLAVGKVDAAIDLMDFSELKESEMAQAKPKLTMLLTMAIEKAKEQGVDMGKIKVKDVAYTDNDTKAAVTVILKDSKGNEKTDVIQTIKKDGKWKIMLK